MSIVQLTGEKAPSRVYAIGDIHGCLDLLRILVREIEHDLASHPTPRPIVVTLGDYIDRGPNSRGVLDMLARNPFSAPLYPVSGNHEQMLLAFLENPRGAIDWTRQGGTDTLASYGVPTKDVMKGKGLSIAAETMNYLMPEEHRRFLERLLLGVRTEHHFFCHAGVRPGVPLDQQDVDDLLWIRDAFLTSEEDFGAIVVHGHTPMPQVEMKANRINLDTGAYRTGILSCAILEADDAHLLTARL